MTRLLLRLFAGVLVAGGIGGVGPATRVAALPAGSTASTDINFTAAAAAPVMQVTEDEPTAQFHPEGEGDYGYTLVTANPSAANALAALAWPGSAVGNAGTLVEVLGGPSVSALNDPVQASAATGTTQTHSSVSAPSGSTMTASVDPTGPTDQHATATSSLAGGGLGGAGSVGHSTSSSTIDFRSDTADLTATAASSASNVDVAGVIHIGAVTSTASARASNGESPKLAGTTTFHDMTVAGEAAYVDGSGVHLGSPAAPAGPAVVDSVDAALAAAGMQVYFTAPHTITVGGTSYYYAASVLFYWAPPSDPSNNSFTLSLGGAAVSMTDSAQPYSGMDLGGDAAGAAGTASSADTSGPSAGVPETSTAQVAATGATSALPPALGSTGDLGAVSTPAGPSGGATLSLPASPSAAASKAGPGTSSPLASATGLPGGVGAGWWVLAAIAAVVGAALTTRLPSLLQRQAAAACPRAARRPGSTFGNGRKA